MFANRRPETCLRAPNEMAVPTSVVRGVPRALSPDHAAVRHLAHTVNLTRLELSTCLDCILDNAPLTRGRS